jgi:hypothetical protein
LKEEAPSLWWARLVEFTIVSRSFKEELPLEKVFGISAARFGNSRGPYDLTIHVAEVGEGYRALPDLSWWGPGKNILTVYRDDNQPGFDGHVAIFDDHQTDKRPPTHFYLQMKLQSTQETVVEDLASALPFTILIHIWRYGKDSITRGDVHFVLYSWGLRRNNSTLNPAAAAAAVAADMRKDILDCWGSVSPCDRSDRSPRSRVAEWATVKGKSVPGGFDELVRDFTEKYFTTNVHVVDGNVLDDWLLPSFLPLPMMLSALGLD